MARKKIFSKLSFYSKNRSKATRVPVCVPMQPKNVSVALQSVRRASGIIRWMITPINAGNWNPRSADPRLHRRRLIFRANAMGIGKRYKLFSLVYLWLRGINRMHAITAHYNQRFAVCRTTGATSLLRAFRFARCLSLHCLLSRCSAHLCSRIDPDTKIPVFPSSWNFGSFFVFRCVDQFTANVHSKLV